jgi:hypothetical protein
MLGLALVRCSGGQDVAGTIEVGNPEKVAGTLVDQNGNPVAGANVRLFPIDYNPVTGQSPQALAKATAPNAPRAQAAQIRLCDTTNASGVFSFAVSPDTLYNLLAVDSVYRNRVFVDSIAAAGSVMLGTVSLTNEVAMSVLVETGFVAGGSVALFGSDISLRVDQPGLVTVKVPSQAPALTYVAGNGATVAVPAGIVAPKAPSAETSWVKLRAQPLRITPTRTNTGASAEYRLDWGDGTRSAWAQSPLVSRVWQSEGTFVVRAQARVAGVAEAVSIWSPGIDITIAAAHTIKRPRRPVGPGAIAPDTPAAYVSGEAQSSLGHAIEYRFAWTDSPFDFTDPDTLTGWDASREIVFTWTSAGTRKVAAQARSVSDTLAQSIWSDYITVRVE